ncbi:hypothetical protein HS7_00310 [Sulfolobales archaeon HS-7]|nr:hypothetical protein HS7_00310 [Sulfolobales archaeon HS-7]
MLPAELARFKFSGNEVKPLFLGLENESAKEICQLFRNNVRVGEILDKSEYLEKVYNYKLIRGLVKVALFLVKLSPPNELSVKVRQEVFSKGPVFDEKKREEILRSIGEKYGSDAEELMWSDQLEYRKVIDTADLNEEKLVRYYNLSLLQTVLFKSTSLEIRGIRDWKIVLRNVKFLGLMYDASIDPFTLYIYGPASLLKMTTKYGRNLALLIPEVVRQDKWYIRAQIVLGKTRKKIYPMEVESGPPMPESSERIEFDSSVEEEFYNSFKRKLPDWRIEREPEPLIANSRVFIPDFLISKGTMKIYVEIVGFWTKAYLETKAEKVKEIRVPLLILANKEGNPFTIKADNVIVFKNKVDIDVVKRWLIRYEEVISSKIDVKPEGKVISLEELSRRYGISKEILRKRSFAGFINTGDYLISEELIDELKKVNLEGISLQEAIEKVGDFVGQVLSILGYEVKWRGIDPSQTVIVRKGNQPDP